MATDTRISVYFDVSDLSRKDMSGIPHSEYFEFWISQPYQGRFFRVRDIFCVWDILQALNIVFIVVFVLVGGVLFQEHILFLGHFSIWEICAISGLFRVRDIIFSIPGTFFASNCEAFF